MDKIEKLCTAYDISIMQYTNLELSIKNIINGSEDTSLPFVPLEVVNYILKGLGFTLEEADTNGYQVDFWYTYKHPNKDQRFTLQGSLWYGKLKLVKE